MTKSNIGNPLDTTTTWTVNIPTYPTKKEIIQRLFNDKLISFEEMWVLLQENNDVRYVPMLYPQPQPHWPVSPWVPWYPAVYSVPFVTYTGTGTSTKSDNGNGNTT